MGVSSLLIGRQSFGTTEEGSNVMYKIYRTSRLRYIASGRQYSLHFDEILLKTAAVHSIPPEMVGLAIMHFTYPLMATFCDSFCLTGRCIRSKDVIPQTNRKAEVFVGTSVVLQVELSHCEIAKQKGRTNIRIVLEKRICSQYLVKIMEYQQRYTTLGVHVPYD